MVYDIFFRDNDYFVLFDRRCDLCKQYIGIAGVFEENWNGQRSVCVFKCTNCYGKRIDIPKVKEEKAFIIIQKRIPGLLPYFPKPPVTKNGSGLSVFDVASIEKYGGETIDKTRYANRSHKLETLSYQDNSSYLDYDDTIPLDKGISWLKGLVEQ